MDQISLYHLNPHFHLGLDYYYHHQNFKKILQIYYKSNLEFIFVVAKNALNLYIILKYKIKIHCIFLKYLIQHHGSISCHLVCSIVLGCDHQGS